MMALDTCVRLARTGNPAPARFTRVHALAVLGGVYLFFEIWTLTAWLADGPSQVTAYRDRDAASWVAARVFEAIAIVVAITVVAYLVRSCRRERRLTFDAKLCISGFLLYWADPFADWAQPVFFYNSNWVNLSNWCGHAPFVVNPDCGRLPEPVLFLSLIYAFGIPAFIMIMNGFMRSMKERRPGWSNLRLLGWTLVAGCLIDAAFEVPIIFLQLWAYPGYPLSFTGGGAHNYPLAAMVGAGLAFTVLAAVRYFKDDRGMTIVERGLDRHRPATASVLTVLALLGISVSAWIVGNSMDAIMGPYLEPFPRMPAEVINGMCDAPRLAPTEYGPCPGSPGYRAPIRELGFGGAPQ